MLTRTLRTGFWGCEAGPVKAVLRGPIDGKFGPGQGFLNAVIAFQKAENLEPDGVIGAKTRARIIEMMAGSSWARLR